MIAANLEDQPMDLSMGPRLETVIRSPTFYTPVAASGGKKFTPSVPSPPAKRTFDELREQEWRDRTPVIEEDALVSSSPASRAKRQRVHGPESVLEEIFGASKCQNDRIVGNTSVESRFFNGPGVRTNQKEKDSTDVSHKAFARVGETVRLRPNSEVISQGSEAELGNDIRYRDSTLNKARSETNTPLEAWNEANLTDGSPDSRMKSSINPGSGWSFENASADGIYNAYMYLNYLPYLLSENSSSERQRMNEILKMSSAPKQAAFPPQVPTAISSIYSAYLASLLLPPKNGSTETPTSEPHHPTASLPPAARCNVELVQEGNRDTSLSGRSHPSVQKCPSDPNGYPNSPALKPEFCARTNSMNETLSHGHQKKQFVRASSFDESLVRGHHTNELLADYDRKFPYCSWFQGYDVNKYNLLRANNSMPDLPSCSRDVPRQSPTAAISHDRLGDLVNRFENPFDKLSSLQTNSPSHNNTINIKNFNIFRDLYSVNDVNNFLKENLRNQAGETDELPGNVKSKLGRHSPDGSTGMVPLPMPSNTKMINGLLIKKKPTRALTGRHVRSGTGASISTLASLREKLEERKNRTLPLTPTSSRPTTRGRGRRKLPL